VRLRSGACLVLTMALAIGPGAATSAAARPSVAADVVAGGGYDTNLFLVVAAAPDSPLYRRYSGPFARVAPSLTGALVGDDARLELRLDADIRQTLGSGALFIEDMQLTLLRPEVGPFDLRLTAMAGRFDATVDAALRFTSAGGAAQAVWRVAEGWRASLAYRLAGRWFGAPAVIGVAHDLTQDGELRVGFTPTRSITVGATVGYLDLRSTGPASSAGAGMTSSDLAGSNLQRPSAGLDTSFAMAGPVSGYAALWTGALRSDGATSDLQVGGTAAVSVRLAAALDGLVRYDILVDRRRGAAAGEPDFERQLVMIGLAAHAAAPRARALPPSSGTLATAVVSAAVTPVASDGPPFLGGGPPSFRVRFRLKAPGARTVAVVGSWNDWDRDATAQTLHIAPETGLWEGSVVLPAGAHRFRFLVDGQLVRPPDAARYRADDFGGEDGIVDVCAEGVSCATGSSLPLQDRVP
jgi:hypothetical protein